MKVLLTLLLACCANLTFGQEVDTKKARANAEAQTLTLLNEIEKKGEASTFLVPRTIEAGELKLVKTGDWTSGFFPGVLWYMYDFTRDKKWLTEAKKYTSYLENEQYNVSTHDVGFIIYCSYGNGYRLHQNEEYQQVIIQAAQSLSKRFKPTVGALRSWDKRKKWDYPVIIDNMMNLELLFAATRFTEDSSFYKIAVAHANTTLKNHFRDDYSSFHVVGYDTLTGKVINKTTHQGYNDESAWARGQAWALYGYTMCYRETGDPAYLRQAEGIASFVLNHPALPADRVPYWDFNDPQIPTVPRDASAAAIISSALFELSGYSKNEDEFRTAAIQILQSLATTYANKNGERKGFILDHSTGHKPVNSEVDVPINYADYYYMEALKRYEDMQNGKNAVKKQQPPAKRAVR